MRDAVFIMSGLVLESVLKLVESEDVEIVGVTIESGVALILEMVPAEGSPVVLLSNGLGKANLLIPAIRQKNPEAVIVLHSWQPELEKGTPAPDWVLEKVGVSTIIEDIEMFMVMAAPTITRTETPDNISGLLKKG